MITKPKSQKAKLVGLSSLLSILLGIGYKGYSQLESNTKGALLEHDSRIIRDIHVDEAIKQIQHDNEKTNVAINEMKAKIDTINSLGLEGWMRRIDNKLGDPVVVQK